MLSCNIGVLISTFLMYFMFSKYIILSLMFIGRRSVLCRRDVSVSVSGAKESNNNYNWHDNVHISCALTFSCLLIINCADKRRDYGKAEIIARPIEKGSQVNFLCHVSRALSFSPFTRSDNSGSGTCANVKRVRYFHSFLLVPSL